MVLRSVKILAVLILLIAGIDAQQPSPTPARIGKSYSSLELERPAPTAPQFASSVTFTDISAQTGINFRHYASATSVIYLPETMSAAARRFRFSTPVGA